jgi:hypothetical protein
VTEAAHINSLCQFDWKGALRGAIGGGLSGAAGAYHSDNCIPDAR